MTSISCVNGIATVTVLCSPRLRGRICCNWTRRFCTAYYKLLLLSCWQYCDIKSMVYIVTAAGLCAFVVNIMSGAWIKYSPFKGVSIAATVIMGIALLYLIQLHLRWTPYLTKRSSVETEASKVTWHLRCICNYTYSSSLGKSGANFVAVFKVLFALRQKTILINRWYLPERLLQSWSLKHKSSRGPMWIKNKDIDALYRDEQWSTKLSQDICKVRSKSAHIDFGVQACVVGFWADIV